MDIGLQVSFSETFNIVGADMISQGIPFVGTDIEIPWAIGAFSADPVSSIDITNKLLRSYNYPWINVKSHQWSMTHFTNRTVKVWVKYFR
jgi:hypothetical protein